MNSRFSRLGVYSLQLSPFILYRDLFGDKNKKRKIFSISDVEKHNTINDGWIIYNNNVYNVTNFIQNHPGGIDMIEKGLGKNIKQYWDQYPIHYDKKVTDLLTPYYIGKLDEDSINLLESEQKNTSDQNIKDSKYTIIKKESPLNIESHLHQLRSSFITDENNWYVRNHHSIPRIDGEKFRLEIDISNSVKKYSLEDLKKFKKTEIVSTIQCAGNRRDEFNSLDRVLGLTWNGGAISNAKFGGVLLRDILDDMKIDITKLSGNEFVQLFGIDLPFDASIPISKVLDISGDVLLAYEMNDNELSPVHGYPIRIIVPGYSGAKNIKWLNKIKISEEESNSTWQKGIAYKPLPSNIKSVEDIKNIDISEIPTVDALPVQSMICNIYNNSTIKFKDGYINLKGIAYSGKGRNIVRVEISTDNGANWELANLGDGSNQEKNRAWAWTFWDLNLKIPKNKDKLEIWCRAVDSDYNTQPKNLEDIWNVRGILNNTWHKVLVFID